MNTPFSLAFEALTSSELVTLSGGYNGFSSFPFDTTYPLPKDVYPVILPIREPYNIDLV